MSVSSSRRLSPEPDQIDSVVVLDLHGVLHKASAAHKHADSVDEEKDDSAPADGKSTLTLPSGASSGRRASSSASASIMRGMKQTPLYVPREKKSFRKPAGSAARTGHGGAREHVILNRYDEDALEKQKEELRRLAQLKLIKQTAVGAQVAKSKMAASAGGNAGALGGATAGAAGVPLAAAASLVAETDTQNLLLPAHKFTLDASGLLPASHAHRNSSSGALPASGRMGLGARGSVFGARMMFGGVPGHVAALQAAAEAAQKAEQEARRLAALAAILVPDAPPPAAEETTGAGADGSAPQAPPSHLNPRRSIIGSNLFAPGMVFPGKRGSFNQLGFGANLMGMDAVGGLGLMGMKLATPSLSKSNSKADMAGKGAGSANNGVWLHPGALVDSGSAAPSLRKSSSAAQLGDPASDIPLGVSISSLGGNATARTGRAGGGAGRLRQHSVIVPSSSRERSHARLPARGRRQAGPQEEVEEAPSPPSASAGTGHAVSFSISLSPPSVPHSAGGVGLGGLDGATTSPRRGSNPPQLTSAAELSPIASEEQHVPTSGWAPRGLPGARGGGNRRTPSALALAGSALSVAKGSSGSPPASPIDEAVERAAERRLEIERKREEVLQAQIAVRRGQGYASTSTGSTKVAPDEAANANEAAAEPYEHELAASPAGDASPNPAPSDDVAADRIVISIDSHETAEDPSTAAMVPAEATVASPIAMSSDAATVAQPTMEQEEQGTVVAGISPSTPSAVDTPAAHEIGSGSDVEDGMRSSEHGLLEEPMMSLPMDSLVLPAPGSPVRSSSDSTRRAGGLGGSSSKHSPPAASFASAAAAAEMAAIADAEVAADMAVSPWPTTVSPSSAQGHRQAEGLASLDGLQGAHIQPTSSPRRSQSTSRLAGSKTGTGTSSSSSATPPTNSGTATGSATGANSTPTSGGSTSSTRPTSRTIIAPALVAATTAATTAGVPPLPPHPRRANGGANQRVVGSFSVSSSSSSAAPHPPHQPLPHHPSRRNGSVSIPYVPRQSFLVMQAPMAPAQQQQQQQQQHGKHQHHARAASQTGAGAPPSLLSRQRSHDFSADSVDARVLERVAASSGAGVSRSRRNSLSGTSSAYGSRRNSVDSSLSPPPGVLTRPVSLATGASPADALHVARTGAVAFSSSIGSGEMLDPLTTGSSSSSGVRYIVPTAATFNPLNLEIILTPTLERHGLPLGGINPSSLQKHMIAELADDAAFGGGGGMATGDTSPNDGTFSRGPSSPMAVSSPTTTNNWTAREGTTAAPQSGGADASAALPSDSVSASASTERAPVPFIIIPTQFKVPPPPAASQAAMAESGAAAGANVRSPHTSAGGEASHGVIAAPTPTSNSPVSSSHSGSVVTSPHAAAAAAAAAAAPAGAPTAADWLRGFTADHPSEHAIFGGKIDDPPPASAPAKAEPPPVVEETPLSSRSAAKALLPKGSFVGGAGAGGATILVKNDGTDSTTTGAASGTGASAAVPAPSTDASLTAFTAALSADQRQAADQARQLAASISLTKDIQKLLNRPAAATLLAGAALMPDAPLSHFTAGVMAGSAASQRLAKGSNLAKRATGVPAAMSPPPSFALNLQAHALGSTAGNAGAGSEDASSAGAAASSPVVSPDARVLEATPGGKPGRELLLRGSMHPRVHVRTGSTVSTGTDQSGTPRAGAGAANAEEELASGLMERQASLHKSASAGSTSAAGTLGVPGASTDSGSEAAAHEGAPEGGIRSRRSSLTNAAGLGALAAGTDAAAAASAETTEASQQAKSGAGGLAWPATREKLIKVGAHARLREPGHQVRSTPLVEQVATGRMDEASAERALAKVVRSIGILPPSALRSVTRQAREALAADQDREVVVKEDPLFRTRALLVGGDHVLRGFLRPARVLHQQHHHQQQPAPSQEHKDTETAALETMENTPSTQLQQDRASASETEEFDAFAAVAATTAASALPVPTTPAAALTAAASPTFSSAPRKAAVDLLIDATSPSAKKHARSAGGAGVAGQGKKVPVRKSVPGKAPTGSQIAELLPQTVQLAAPAAMRVLPGQSEEKQQSGAVLSLPTTTFAGVVRLATEQQQSQNAGKDAPLSVAAPPTDAASESSVPVNEGAVNESDSAAALPSGEAAATDGDKAAEQSQQASQVQETPPFLRATSMRVHDFRPPADRSASRSLSSSRSPSRSPARSRSRGASQSPERSGSSTGVRQRSQRSREREQARLRSPPRRVAYGAVRSRLALGSALAEDKGVAVRKRRHELERMRLATRAATAAAAAATAAVAAHASTADDDCKTADPSGTFASTAENFPLPVSGGVPSRGGGGGFSSGTEDESGFSSDDDLLLFSAESEATALADAARRAAQRRAARRLKRPYSIHARVPVDVLESSLLLEQATGGDSNGPMSWVDSMAQGTEELAAISLAAAMHHQAKKSVPQSNAASNTSSAYPLPAAAKPVPAAVANSIPPSSAPSSSALSELHQSSYSRGHHIALDGGYLVSAVSAAMVAQSKRKPERERARAEADLARAIEEIPSQRVAAALAASAALASGGERLPLLSSLPTDASVGLFSSAGAGGAASTAGAADDAAKRMSADTPLGRLIAQGQVAHAGGLASLSQQPQQYAQTVRVHSTQQRQQQQQQHMAPQPPSQARVLGSGESVSARSAYASAVQAAGPPPPPLRPGAFLGAAAASGATVAATAAASVLSPSVSHQAFAQEAALLLGGDASGAASTLASKQGSPAVSVPASSHAYVRPLGAFTARAPAGSPGAVPAPSSLGSKLSGAAAVRPVSPVLVTPRFTFNLPKKPARVK